MRPLKVLALALALCGAHDPASALDTLRDRYTLRGIPSISVVVDISEKLEQAGLSSATVQTDVELRLRSLGIRVLGETDPDFDPRSYLYVNVSGFRGKTAKGESREFVTSIEVSFNQQMMLPRDPSAAVIAQTWSIAIVALDSSTTGVQKNLRELVDRFANAYLSVNPRRSPLAAEETPSAP